MSWISRFRLWLESPGWWARYRSARGKQLRPSRPCFRLERLEDRTTPAAHGFEPAHERHGHDSSSHRDEPRASWAGDFEPGRGRHENDFSSHRNELRASSADWFEPARARPGRGFSSRRDESRGFSDDEPFTRSLSRSPEFVAVDLFPADVPGRTSVEPVPPGPSGIHDHPGRQEATEPDPLASVAALHHPHWSESGEGHDRGPEGGPGPHAEQASGEPPPSLSPEGPPDPPPPLPRLERRIEVGIVPLDLRAGPESNRPIQVSALAVDALPAAPVLPPSESGGVWAAVLLNAEPDNDPGNTTPLTPTIPLAFLPAPLSEAQKMPPPLREERLTVRGVAEPKQEEPPFESTPRQGTAPGLDFLLDQGLMALLFRPDSLGGHPLHARDTADLLPLRERILGLVAALFTARDTSSSESPPSPARSGAKEGNSPPRQVEVRRAAEAIPPGPLDPRLLEFLAGVKPLLPPRKAKEVAPPWAESQPPSGTDTRSEAQDGSADEGGGEAPSAPAE